MTYPTSYEALVGRANLQTGTHTKPVIGEFSSIFPTMQVNGY